MRTLREAVAGLRRAPLLSGLSIASVGLSLLIVGLFALAAHNVDLALRQIESRVEIVAFVADGTPASRIDLAESEIASFPEVAEVRHVSKVEALYEAARELPEFSDVYSDLQVNPLPSSFEIRLRDGYRTPAHVGAVAARVATYEFVEEVSYGRGWVEKLHELRRIAGGATLILGGAFAAGAVLLIGIAVRMAILARGREISIMETVGAKEGTIRRPFLLEGLLTGLAGGLLALALTRAAFLLLGGAFPALAWLPDAWILGGIAAAALLGMAAATRAVRRELRGRHAA